MNRDMNRDPLLLRIWLDVVGLVVPLLAMAAYLLGWSGAVRVVLTTVCFVGVLGTSPLFADRASWRATQRARVRRVRRWIRIARS
jgi:hypothetical protein